MAYFTGKSKSFSGENVLRTKNYLCGNFEPSFGNEQIQRQEMEDIR